jgi:hypothetical protein
MPAPTPISDQNDLIVSTYFSLRVGLTVLAALLPPVLYLWGKTHGVPLQYSMSAYYHADAAGLSCPGGHGVARDLFVGGLFAVGGLLYAYRGVTALENWTLNVAGLLAGAIALFPMRITCNDIPNRFTPHGTFAILFFLSIAAVAVFAGPSTLDRIKDPKLRGFFRQGYRITGFVMVVAPGTVIAWSVLTGTYAEHTFAIEVAGIYAFAAFWILKSWEIHKANEALFAAAPAPPAARPTAPEPAAPRAARPPAKYAV